MLALHSFRTSAKIFKEQVRRSGLEKRLGNLVELVYLDAPHAATGPPPADVAPFFDPPYREWWRAEKNVEKGEYLYEGGVATVEFVRQYIIDEGPFDGIWAFSQGSLLASMLLSLKLQGRLPQAELFPWFLVSFGGFFDAKKVKANKMAMQVLADSRPLKCPSLHVIGERDALSKFSLVLAEQYVDSTVIMHPRGHIVPALDDGSFSKLEGFLQDCRASLQSRSKQIESKRSRL